MEKNKGFIATSLLYSFFLVFCALLLALVGSFMHNRVLLDHTVENIKKDLSTATNKTLILTEVGDYVKIPLFSSRADINLENVKWIVAGHDASNKTITLVSDNVVVMTNNYRNINLFNEEVNSYFNLYTTGSTSGSYVRSLTNQDITNFQSISNITIRKALLSEGNPFLYRNTSNNRFYLYRYTCTTSDTCSVTTNQLLQTTNTNLYGLRLMITLADTTPIASGAGTINDPYNLLYYIYQKDNNNVLKLHYDYLNTTKNLGFQTTINTITDLSGNNYNGTFTSNHTNSLSDGITFSIVKSLQTDLQICSVFSSNGYSIELLSKRNISLVANPSNQNIFDITGNGSSTNLRGQGIVFGDVTPNVFHTYSFIKRPGSNIMIYIDGKYKQTSVTANFPCILSNVLFLGAVNGSGTNGYLKSLRFYKTALTDAEILRNYNVDQRWKIS